MCRTITPIQKEKIYYPEFETEVTAHYLGKVICEVMDLNTLSRKEEYDDSQKAYCIYKIENEFLKPLFAIKLKKHNKRLRPSTKENEFLIKVSSANINTKEFENKLEEIIKKVNQEASLVASNALAKSITYLPSSNL